MAVQFLECTGTNITSATTTAVFAGKGFLHTIVVNTTAAGTIIVKDGTTVKATLKASVGENTYMYNMTIGNGLNIVTGAASDITVNWMQ